jgi:hypothetical protein
MTIKRLGATKKYADNWEEIFGRGAKRSSGKKTPIKSATGSTAKKSAKKKAAKKSPPRVTAKKKSRKAK